MHVRAGQQQVFAVDAAQELDSPSDPGLVQALTAGSPGKTGLLHEASQHDGIHVIARDAIAATRPQLRHGLELWFELPTAHRLDSHLLMPLNAPENRRRGIYILPNLFTTAALFAGFYAIVQAMQGRFEVSAVAIFVAMLLDGLDGRVARLTNTQSEFGAEYDSLSDMVSFGAAPALVMYEWALKDLGKLGWIAAFIFCAGAALRLARFNTNIASVDKRYFQGLPSPAAAALIAGMVWVTLDNGIAGEDVAWLAFVLTIFAGLSMVSNVLFWSGKDINLRKSVPFIVVIAVVLGFALVSTYPPGVLFGLFVAYALSGYVIWAWRWSRRRRHPLHAGSEPDTDSDTDRNTATDSGKRPD